MQYAIRCMLYTMHVATCWSVRILLPNWRKHFTTLLLQFVWYFTLGGYVLQYAMLCAICNTICNMQCFVLYASAVLFKPLYNIYAMLCAKLFGEERSPKLAAPPFQQGSPHICLTAQSPIFCFWLNFHHHQFMLSPCHGYLQSLGIRMWCYSVFWDNSLCCYELCAIYKCNAIESDGQEPTQIIWSSNFKMSDTRKISAQFYSKGKI